MKKYLAGFLVLLLSFYSSVCFSEENQQSKFQVSLGIKSFLNKWESSSSQESKNGIIAGPTLKIGYNNFFCGISYLSSLSSYDTKYRFEESTFDSDVEISLDRNDIDIIVGYMLHSRIGVFGGYKYIKYDMAGVTKNTEYYYNKNTNQVYYNITEADNDGEYKSKGPAIGVTANYPLPITNLVLVGAITYMKLDHEYDMHYSVKNGKKFTISDSNDGSGYSIEPGIVYLINEHISVNAGLKYQIIKADNSEDDKFTGISLGCDYRF